MFNFEQIKESLNKHGYEYKQILGRGESSSVLLCQSSKHNKDIAVRRAVKHRLTDYEFNNLNRFDHPNIVKLYDAFEDPIAQYIVMEYCTNGSIQQKGRLSYEKFVFYAKQILEAIAYCHSNKIAHHDVKPQNIFIDKNDKIKLAKVGMVKKVGSNDISREILNSYMFYPPEMFVKDEICPFKADIWSLGITFFFMATGNYPFQSENFEELKKKISMDKLNFFQYKVHPKIRILINKMTSKNHFSRPSANELLKLPIFSNNSKKSLVISGNQRCRINSSLRIEKPIFLNGFQNQSRLMYMNSGKKVRFNPEIEFNKN